MKNKNLYTMEQPELGKKIQELRKSKGLTQEELVEQCNINVRTIQRIEAGEVSPRTFTLKTILEVLGVNPDTFFVKEMNPIQEVEVNKLRLSWIGGILFAIFATIGVAIESITWDNDQPFEGELVYWSVYGILTLTAVFFFLRGYKVLGDNFNSKILSIGSYLYFISEFLIILTAIVITVFDFDESWIDLIVGVPAIVLIGVSEIILGVGILKLKNNFGSLAQIIGIFKIVNGAMFVSFILAVFAAFLVIPVLIMEIVFLWKAAEKLSE